MEKELLEQLHQIMVDGIDSVLDGSKKSFKTRLPIFPRMVEKYLIKKNKDWDKSDNFDTNGWDYDWWLTFEKDGVSYTASGSGFEGGFEFSKDED